MVRVGQGIGGKGRLHPETGVSVAPGDALRECPKRDDRTGLEVWSKEDVYDQRAPVSVGVCISACMIYRKKIVYRII